MSGYENVAYDSPRPPRVVVFSLASCFGCQVMITNIESHLLDVLGLIDLRYWQLASSVPMPEDYDVAVIEGAVTTEESEALVRKIRATAKTVISIGACANTAGIPGMAADHYYERPIEVYDEVPEAAGTIIQPRSVPSVIKVDGQVLCCPIDPLDFVATLQSALYGSNRMNSTKTLCGDCKLNGTSCFYGKGIVCLGMVTQAGCGARCVNLGRPCNGCAGLSVDANLDSAREACERYGVSVQEFDEALEMFNQTNSALKARR